MLTISDLQAEAVETGLTNPGINAATGAHNFRPEGCWLHVAVQLVLCFTAVAGLYNLGLLSAPKAQQAVAAACLWQDIAGGGSSTGRAAVGSCLEAEAGNNSTITEAHRSSELALYATLIASARSALGSLILLMRGAPLVEDFKARSCQTLPALDSRLPAAAAGHVGGGRQAGP